MLLTCFALLLGASLLPGRLSAQMEYVDRNNAEVYASALLWDNLTSVTHAENRFWETESARRYLSMTYGEARLNRKFFADIQLQGMLPLGGFVYPVQIEGQLREVLLDADVAVRAEAYGQGRVGKNWDLALDLATLNYLRQEIPSAFQARLVATHHGFAGIAPLSTGFFAGPEVRAADVGVSGMTVGAFALLSSSRRALTRATARMTWWSSRDIFQNQLQFRVGQTVTAMKRRVTLQASAGIDLRQLRKDRYIASFLIDPDRTRYVDLVLEAGVLARLPLDFRLNLQGRILPYHTPDVVLIRWYRPVWPELSAVLYRKLAVFDFTAGYTFALFPPAKSVADDYPDTGGPFFPEAVPSHLLSFTLGLRI